MYTNIIRVLAVPLFIGVFYRIIYLTIIYVLHSRKGEQIGEYGTKVLFGTGFGLGLLMIISSLIIIALFEKIAKVNADKLTQFGTMMCVLTTGMIFGISRDHEDMINYDLRALEGIGAGVCVLIIGYGSCAYLVRNNLISYDSLEYY